MAPHFLYHPTCLREAATLVRQSSTCVTESSILVTQSSTCVTESSILVTQSSTCVTGSPILVNPSSIFCGNRGAACVNRGTSTEQAQGRTRWACILRSAGSRRGHGAATTRLRHVHGPSTGRLRFDHGANAVQPRHGQHFRGAVGTSGTRSVYAACVSGGARGISHGAFRVRGIHDD
jgi:hypothetical protein